MRRRHLSKSKPAPELTDSFLSGLWRKKRKPHRSPYEAIKEHRKLGIRIRTSRHWKSPIRWVSFITTTAGKPHGGGGHLALPDEPKTFILAVDGIPDVTSPRGQPLR